MNSPSNKILRLLVLGLVWGQALAALGASSENIFSVVPEGDPTYGQLRQLSAAGLLSPQEAVAPLSRYDVAKRLVEARDRYGSWVVAQARNPSAQPVQGGVEGPAPTANPATNVGRTLDRKSTRLNSSHLGISY